MLPARPLEAQATLVLLWQVTQGIFNALLVTGFLLLPIGVTALGVGMFKAPAFGKGFGGLSVVLGVVGVVVASVLLVDPPSPVAVVVMLALIVFHLVLGWKVYSLSRAPLGVLKIGERAGALKTMQEGRVNAPASPEPGSHLSPVAVSHDTGETKADLSQPLRPPQPVNPASYPLDTHAFDDVDAC